jgi:hypothetical protein
MWVAFLRPLTHEGPYCSVVLGIRPISERIPRDGSPWPQPAVLEALIDVYGSFKPESEEEHYSGTPLEG